MEENSSIRLRDSRSEEDANATFPLLYREPCRSVWQNREGRRVINYILLTFILFFCFRILLGQLLLRGLKRPRGTRMFLGILG